MNKFLLWIFSIGTALSVAMIFLNQPLLEILRVQFNATLSNIGLIVTFTQIGYALGILFLVPIGDIVVKKKLIQIKLIGIVFMLLLAGVSQTLLMFFFASLAIGIFATAAQDFVPLAVDLAPEAERGKVVGTVMSGLLVGILLSRTFSGVIAQHLGWRAVFFISAVLIFVLFMLTFAFVPSHPPKVKLKYIELMRSMGKLLFENPLLQLSLIAHGLIGLIFSSFWTVLTFHLSGIPFQLSTSSIGLFGLAGAAGAIAAPLAGRSADKRGPLLNIKLSILFVFLSFILMFKYQYSIIALIIGIIVFDLGVQISLISHQSIIYAMNPHARARINSLFVTGLFIFFSIGSFLGSLVFSHYGWLGVVYLSLMCCIISFIFHLALARKYRAEISL
jgi:predicted MFS family arabinose efflux permease